MITSVTKKIDFWRDHEGQVYRCDFEKTLFLQFLGLVLRRSHFLKMDLFHAIRANNLERVRFLVEQGADKDKVDGTGSTPLLWASDTGHLGVTQYLVEQGATLDKASSYGATPLIVAAANGNLEVARYLLEQGADRDKAANNGYNPLHYAALHGYLEIAMLLMSYGADLNARDTYGYTPIDMARTKEMKQAIRDEPSRRMDHGHNRATEQDRHPNAATLASAQQDGEQEEEKEEENDEQSNKRPRLGEGAVVLQEVAEEETKVASEDEDSEPSDDVDDN